MPEMGRQSSHPSPTLRGVRVFRLSGFEKHLVYYLPLPGNGGIEILHVLHTARDLPALLEEDES